MVLLIGLIWLLSLSGVTDSQRQLTTIKLFKAMRTWNDALKFCSARSMNLLEVRAKVKADVLDWIDAETGIWNNKFQDSWIGLHGIASPTSFGYSWAGGCTPHNGDGTSWADWFNGEPLNQQSNKCVKIVKSGPGFAWRSESCSQKKMLFCESVGGACRFHQQTKSADINLLVTILRSGISSAAQCKNDCLTYTGESGECWGVSYGLTCTFYIASSPVQLLSPAPASTFYAKQCFIGDYDGTDDQNSPDTSSNPNTGCILGQALTTPAMTTTTSTTTTSTTTTSTTTTTTSATTTTTTTTTPTTSSTTTSPTTPTTPTTTTSATTTSTTTNTPITTTSATTSTQTTTTPTTTLSATTSTPTTTTTPTTTLSATTSTPTTTTTPTTTLSATTSIPTTTTTPTTTPSATTTTPTLTTTSAPTMFTTVTTNTPTHSTVTTAVTSVLQTTATTTTATGPTISATTQAWTVSTVGAWNQTGFEICSCKCNSTDDKTLEEKIEEIIAYLIVDKTKTSKSIRKKISAPDNRPSAQNIGFLGIALLVATGGLFLVADSTYIFQLIKFICGKKR